jgi:microcystin-dependent protein
MKKILTLLVCLISSSAWAGVPCSVPFQLQNNTVADATQVMANYNAILTCLSNAAASGANNDITSLNALSTPITPAQGGTPIFVGGISTGSGNAQIVPTVVPSVFSLSAGRLVTFFAGFSNTSATTLNVAGSGNVNIFRRTQLGISAMVGGEIIAGYPVTVQYDGTQFICMTCGPYMVGEIRDFASGSLTGLTGWTFIDGSCLSRTTYADLFSLIGTAYDPTGSTCDSSHFALPDGRGRVLVGWDDQGGTPANRITLAGSGCNGGVVGGAGCGLQNVTIAQNQLPNVAPTFTGSSPGSITPTTNATVIVNSGGGQFGASGGSIGTGSFNAITLPNSTGSVGSINGGVTQIVTPILPPLQIVIKIIKL